MTIKGFVRTDTGDPSEFDVDVEPDVWGNASDDDKIDMVVTSMWEAGVVDIWWETQDESEAE